MAWRHLLYNLMFSRRVNREHRIARPQSDHPTELELKILKILWERSPLPVREIRQGLAAAGHDIAHTSTITTLVEFVERLLMPNP